MAVTDENRMNFSSSLAELLKLYYTEEVMALRHSLKK